MTTKFLLLCTLVFVLVFHIDAIAQNTDSLQAKELNEVMVTATRTERTVGSLPMPVTLVNKDLIKSMGSVRLNDVLTEQTGLVVVPQVNGQGNGIQIQGFDPDYTLILVDGEPIIGRYTGSLELSRLTVGNIKQVEIVKGPSSSLYGSDALAGVINVITERPTTHQGSFLARYGTNSSFDLNANGALVFKNFNIDLFANRYSTDGYDLSTQNYGKTVSPFFNYTLGAKINYQLGKTDFNIGFRYFSEAQDFNFDVVTNGNSERTNGEGTIKDWSINPVITHRFNQRFKIVGRFYNTRYSTNTFLKRAIDDVITYQDNFNQTFTRYELNSEYFFNNKHVLTAGIGDIKESVTTSRYNDQLERTQQTDYFFLQHEWTPIQYVTVIGGIRYDNNSVYGDQLSPKLSARFEVTKNITLKGSFGLGFKAPDFRQLYFNFANQAGGGYIVLGTEVIKEKFNEYIAIGQIQPGATDLSRFASLQPERSKSFNFGADFQLTSKLKIATNTFYNIVDNLINSELVTTNSLGKNIFSYTNVNRALTKGIESDVTYSLNDKLSFSMGHQLLYAFDRDIAEQVENGKKFWKDPITLETRKLQPSEYVGLYNRSRHSGTFKIFYSNKPKGLEGSLRVIYRGKFGIGGISGNIQGESITPSDRNGNGLLDDYDFFVNGYALVNLSVAKNFNQFRLQVGVDNLFDHKEPIYIPNLPGRLLYINVGFTIKNNYKNN
jgi:outer membrane receptor for ferrienterochelin and colicins